jgi:opacity protein-like surface antigen
MKKIVSIFLFFVWSFCSIFGQSEIRFGFQASPSFSFMKSATPKVIEGNGTNLGLKLGATAEKYFKPDRFAVTTGLGFAFNTGGTLRYANEGKWLKNSLPLDTLIAGTNVHYRLSYVEIPIGLKMRGGSGEDSYLNFFAELPIITLGFRTKAIADVREPSKTSVDDVDIKKDAKPINASWGLGGGVEYNISPNTALVGGIYYQQGFFDVTKDDGVKSAVRSLTVRLGILF